MSDTALREKVQKTLAEKREDASKKWAAFDKARKEVKSEDVDLAKDNDAFEKLDNIHKEYSTVASEVKELEGKLDKLIMMDSEGEPTSPFEKDAPVTPEAKTLQAALRQMGENVIESKQYKALLESGVLGMDGAHVNMTPVKTMERAQFKTLITGASDTSGGAFVVNDRDAGFVELPQRQFIVAQLVTIGDTDSDTVEYVEMTSRTNAAAETAEAGATGDGSGAAPESAMALVVRTSNVRDITHFYPATKRALADAGQLRSIIDDEGRDGVQERLDLQMVSGGGTGENLKGILNTAGIGTQALGTDSRADAIHKALTKIRAEFYEPDAVGSHPKDWEQCELEKDANGNYLLGGPGKPGPRQIWGVPVSVNPVFTEGTMLPGAFRRGAKLWIREGVTVAASDSHDDFFIRKMVAVLFSTRAAFAVQRPKAFCTVTGA